MNLPFTLQFDGLAHSDAVEDLARSRVEHLERHFADLTACRVAISRESRHGQAGGFFSARVAMTLPGRELIVSHAHEHDAYIALRDAFDAVSRRLEDSEQVRRGRVKTHATLSGRRSDDAAGE